MPDERVIEELAPARLSLWDIESAWLELIQGRQEAEAIENTAERELALAACDQAIAEYTTRETVKVDGIRAVVRGLKAAMETAKQERDYQAKRAQSAEAMIARIKGFVQAAMEAAGKKRIEGRTGCLLLKKNGSVHPLEISGPSMIPDECIRLVGSIPLKVWRGLLESAGIDGVEGIEFRREVDNAAVRAALQEPCPACGGHPELIVRMKPDDPEGCAACGGSGRNAVPGARLLDRGSHVEIK